MGRLQKTFSLYADKTEVDPMKLMLSARLCALLLAGASLYGGYVQAAGSPVDVITSAVADPGRTEGERNRDAARKPVESLQFSGVKPGDAVADFNAGAGYFTHLFSDVVGTRGHVYAIEPVEIQQYIAKSTAELRDYAVSHRNITVSVETALESLHLPRKLDIFWISQNYHDLHNKYFGPLDIAAFNKAVFDALKPGGSYVVLDHTAAPGAAADVTETLHRIDPAVVRREVEAAGFIFDNESKILANPADPRTIKVFDQSIQGHTDQFILKFRKPQTPTAALSVHDGQHDFDFNIGVWHTHIKRILDPFASGSESVELNGTVTVRKVWDGKAELEEIEADGPKGHWEGLTLFLYNPSAHQWSQSFANSKVGTLSSNVGESNNGRVVLIGQDTVNDRTILVRAMWSNIKPDSHQYEESYSNDGGTTWVRSFIANLTRSKQ
jgi:predicted methyltransferase